LSHRGGSIWPQVQLTDRIVDIDQLLGELPQAAAFGNLPARFLKSGGGNGSLAGGVSYLPLKEPQGAVTGIALPSAPTVRLPALAETGKQTPRSKIADPGELPTNGIAPIVEGSEIFGGHKEASRI